MDILGIINGKGGVAKTTTAANLATQFALHGYRTCVVDWDGQGDVTRALHTHDDRAATRLVDALRGKKPTTLKALARKVGPNLWLVRNGETTDGQFQDALYDLRHEQGEEATRHSLRNLLDTGVGTFDVVVIDSGPYQGLPRRLVLHAATQLVVPVQAQVASIEGLANLTGFIEDAQRQGARAQVLGILPVAVDDNLKLTKTMMTTLGNYYGGYVLRSYIRLDARLPESWAKHTLKNFSKRKSASAEDYRDAYVEIANRLFQPVVEVAE